MNQIVPNRPLSKDDKVFSKKPSSTQGSFRKEEFRDPKAALQHRIIQGKGCIAKSSPVLWSSGAPQSKKIPVSHL